MRYGGTVPTALLDASPVEVAGPSRQYLHNPDLGSSTVGDQRLTIAEAAARLNVHENTVRKWIDRGILPASRLPTGARRLLAADVAALTERIAGRLRPVSKDGVLFETRRAIANRDLTVIAERASRALLDETAAP